jgi:CheY-like chemotaxis protein
MPEGMKMPTSTPSLRIIDRPVVLVVEDDPITLRLSVCATKAAGFDAIAVTSADEALSVLETRADIRVVFTDVQMPGSMNGIQLAAVIVRRWPAIRILITSAQIRLADKNLPGHSVFLSKPYLVREVVAKLQHLSDSYAVESSHGR